MSARVEGGKRSAGTKGSGKLSFRSLPKEPLEDAKTEVLFEVDDVEYTMPAVVPAATAISILWVIHQMEKPFDQGFYLIRQLVDEKAMTALLNSDLTPEQWSELIDKAWKHTFNQLEAADSGN